MQASSRGGGLRWDDRALYVADYLRYRVVRVRVEYEAQEEAPVTVGK